MLISELRKFSYLDPRLAPEEASKYKSAIKYIEHLGSVTNTDVSGWPIDLFLNKQTERVYLDRQNINEVFFTFQAKVAKEAVPEIVFNSAPITNGIENLISDRKDSIFYEISELNRQLSKLNKEVESRLMKKTDLNLTLLGLNSVNPNIILDDVKALLSQGYWKALNKPLSKSMWFEAVRPVILTYFNKKQGRENVLNLGHVRAEICFGKVLELKCFPPGINKTHSLANAHPHISMDGNPCWGSLKPAYEDAVASLSIKGMLFTLSRLLQTYTEGDAFISIYNFEENMYVENPPVADEHILDDVDF